MKDASSGPVAAVILAAGGSSRMGQPKQLLPWRGRPMVRVVAETVCAAGLAQVVVVVGASADLVRAALDGLPVEVQRNENWAGGLGSSVRKGVQALRPEIEAVVMVLADQPALSRETIEALVERHRASGSSVVIPAYRGRRGNPVLFGRSLFPELLAVEGDQGGRSVIMGHQAEWEVVAVEDPLEMEDVDTREDYERVARNHGTPQRSMSTRTEGDRTAALLAATLASFLTPFMGAAVTVALPEIGRAFALDALLLGWIPTSYLLAAAVFLVPFGRVADIAGRKKVFLLGIGLFTAASLLCGVAPSGPVLIGARVLQGIGSAMIFGTGVAILTSVFPVGERGRVLGINTAAVYIGLSVGPTVGGVLTRALGWRSIFLVNVPLGLLVILVVCARLKGEWRSGARGYDWPGSALYGVSLVGLMLGFSRLPGWEGAALLGAGLVGLVLFGWWETRSAHPVLDLRLFRSNRPFTFSSLAALINYSATSAVTFLVSLYLQYVKALSPQQAGLILVAQPIVQATLSPLAGRLSDRLEPRLVASIGMGITSVGLALLIPVGQSTPLWTIVARLVILGCGFGLFSSPNVNAIMSSVERSSYGVASSVAGTMRLVGQMLSMGIAMLLFALFIGRVELTASAFPQFLTSARAAFGIFTALCIAGTFASLARGKIR